MPRAARSIIDGRVYHILTRGNNDQPVFRQDLDFQQYIQLLGDVFRTHRVDLYHYVLMPNHVHLLVRPTSGAALSRAMFTVNLTYARLFQRRYRYSGHLWQGRFKSLLIDTNCDLLVCGGYLESQPVRAGLIQDAASYSWSSHAFYAAGIRNDAITTNPTYLALGDSQGFRQTCYQQLIQTSVMQHLESQTIRNWSFSTMAQELQHHFGVKHAGRRPGRPRKNLMANSAFPMKTALIVGILSAQTLAPI